MSVVEFFLKLLFSVFFSLYWYHRVQERYFYFEMISAGKYRSVIVTLKKSLKLEFVLKFQEIATVFLQKSKAQLFDQGFN